MLREVRAKERRAVSCVKQCNGAHAGRRGSSSAEAEERAR